MIASSYLIYCSKEVLDETLHSIAEVYAIFPIEFQERITNIMNSSGIYFIIIPAIACIIFNAVILFLAFSDRIVKKRGLLIFLSVLCIVFSSSFVSMILAAFNLIILLSIKKKEKDKIVKEKKKIPSTTTIDKKGSKKELIYSAIIFGFYFSQFIWKNFLPDNNRIILLLAIILFYVTMYILVFTLFGNIIICDCKKLFKNFGAYIEYDLPRYSFMFLSFIFINLICIIITKNATSINQKTVESLPKLIMFVLAVLWAPIVEEVVFRGCIKKFINTKIVFIVLSAFVFGFLHAAVEESLLNILITTLPYATLGGWLAYIYYDTDNIVNNILIHATWNFFAVIFSFLVSCII